MKKFLITLGIFLLTVLAYQHIPIVHNLLSYSPCTSPITYKIGSIDKRFGLTRQEVLSHTNEAANKWNSITNSQIFAYDYQGKVTINLVYDQRQQLSSQINDIQKKLDSDKNNLYPQIEDYKKRSAAFDQAATALNQDITYWNSRGGAPQDEYDKLVQRQKELQQEASNLNILTKQLNQSARDYNSQIGVLNQTESKLGQTLATKPEEGLYNGNDDTISIYFNNTKAELIHTLSHELGHARGIDHNNNPNSIMFPSSTEMTTPTTEDIAGLTQACKKRSYFELILEGYANFIRMVEYKFTQAKSA